MSGPVCAMCGKPIESGDYVFSKVEGWEQPAHERPSGKHGGSDIVLRRRTGEAAHAHCVMLARQGLSVNQGTLV